MGFKLDLSPAYFGPVTLPVLDADGKLQNHLFDAQFKRLTDDELGVLEVKMSSRSLDDEGVLDEVMVGWRGVTDAKDQPIAYSPQSRRDVCRQVPGMRVSLCKAFFASLEPKASAHLSEKN